MSILHGVSISAAMRRRASEGHQANRIPLGYRREWREGGEVALVPVWEITDPLRNALRSVSNGMSLRQALAHATAEGLKNRNGLPLAVSSFHLAATNPFYAGLVRFNGELYPGRHEPIISREEYQRIQQALGRNRHDIDREARHGLKM